MSINLAIALVIGCLANYKLIFVYTVDFPSSPSAMMKYRVAEDEEDSQEQGDHQPQHNGTIHLPSMAFSVKKKKKTLQIVFLTLRSLFCY